MSMQRVENDMQVFYTDSEPESATKGKSAEVQEAAISLFGAPSQTKGQGKGGLPYRRPLTNSFLGLDLPTIPIDIGTRNDPLLGNLSAGSLQNPKPPTVEAKGSSVRGQFLLGKT